MPSKLDDHFVGAFHWQYETIHIINGKKNTIAYIRILYEKYPQYQHLTPLTKGYQKFQGGVCESSILVLMDTHYQYETISDINGIKFLNIYILQEKTIQRKKWKGKHKEPK